MTSTTSVEQVDAHYGVPALDETILAALQAAGRDLGALTVADLTPVDHFHMGGLAATEDLVRLVDPAPGLTVLDVGGGLGGAARLLASRLDATVTVLDATREYCRVGARLTDLVGLSDRVDFRHGDACAMPYGDECFDLAWSQHATMNISAKDDLYREIHRVLRPGGRLAWHEVTAGPNQPIHFPVPWADQPSVSALQPQSQARARLAAAGFTELHWEDITGPSLAWWRQRLATVAEHGVPPVGVHLLMGPDTPVKSRNMVRNLEQGRATVTRAVLRRG